MKKTTARVFKVVFLLGLGSLYAQESTSSSGNNAIGPGGSSSYTVGQVNFTMESGINGSVSQGVQYAYEITDQLGINETSINLEINTYPNPTTDFLTLKVVEIKDLAYQIYDINGKLIDSNKVYKKNTVINMKNFPAAIYLLKVIDRERTVKVFQIIKK